MELRHLFNRQTPDYARDLIHNPRGWKAVQQIEDRAELLHQKMAAHSAKHKALWVEKARDQLMAQRDKPVIEHTPTGNKTESHRDRWIRCHNDALIRVNARIAARQRLIDDIKIDMQEKAVQHAVQDLQQKPFDLQQALNTVKGHETGTERLLALETEKHNEKHMMEAHCNNNRTNWINAETLNIMDTKLTAAAYDPYDSNSTLPVTWSACKKEATGIIDNRIVSKIEKAGAAHETEQHAIVAHVMQQRTALDNDVTTINHTARAQYIANSKQFDATKINDVTHARANGSSTPERDVVRI